MKMSTGPELHAAIVGRDEHLARERLALGLGDDEQRVRQQETGELGQAVLVPGGEIAMKDRARMPDALASGARPPACKALSVWPGAWISVESVWSAPAMYEPVGAVHPE